MKAEISRNLVLCLEAETEEEAALLRIIDSHYDIKLNGSGKRNASGPQPGGGLEYITFKFEHRA